MEEVRFPIAETFDSLQGEGLWTGTRMFFIRVAGCPVPEPVSIGYEIYRKCTFITGQEFTCDTDFRLKERLTIKEILERIPSEVRHISLTGGEPFAIPRIWYLISELRDHFEMIHLETSGTIDPDWLSPDINRFGGKAKLWISVSPKINVHESIIKDADEIKVLVGDDFDLSKLPRSVLSHKLVWLQPINGINGIIERRVQKCIEIIMSEMPNWRLSTQAHKSWGMR